MPKQPRNRTSTLTTHPICTAVQGCTRPAQILSYKLSGGAWVRICGMHLQRLKHAGDLGGASSAYGMARQRAAREDKILGKLRAIHEHLGAEFWMASTGRGTCELQSEKRSYWTAQHGPKTVLALERRGWVSVGPWLDDGRRRVVVTAKGLAVLG